MKQTHVGIIGGGVSGSTTALRLEELGLRVSLFEEGPSLVNGPPVCHLHAGGNLYREISDQQCVNLLRQSVDSVRYYPHTINLRPTVISVPKRDQGASVSLLPRLKLLKEAYKQLVKEDPANQVLGNPDEYYKVYEREDMLRLSYLQQPTPPSTLDDWMIAVARNINLDDFHFPFVMVQEYGISLFRVAATVEMSLKKAKNCDVHTNSKVTKVHSLEKGGWTVSCENGLSVDVDYLVNACGYRTGTIDDLTGYHRDRMVEFKAAYLTHWPEVKEAWPEVIFHGVRGTPEGMGELTPYVDGYFQVHGMTKEITLFKKGLVASSESSAQPQLPKDLSDQAEHRWAKSVVEERTHKAIAHIGSLVPSFMSATVGGKPLYGVQQIPGADPSLRVADVSFEGDRYARTEIVKLSSSLDVAKKIYLKMQSVGLVPQENTFYFNPTTSLPSSLSFSDVETRAQEIAKERNYPMELGTEYSADRNVKVSNHPHIISKL